MKKKSSYSCGTCGFDSPRWFGRCPDCGSWSSAAEAGDAPAGAMQLATLVAGSSEAARVATGDAELDRVLGGGLVLGSVVLLSGEPGIGKSTLLLQMASSLLQGGRTVVYATAEESLEQVSLRARRLGIDPARITAGASSSVTAIEAAARSERPDVLIVDSIQTIEDPSVESAAGSVAQVRSCAARIVRFAKESGVTVVLVGHVTKDGNVAGPKTLEHVVDAVVSLEGDHSAGFRLLRATKNRYGSCDETGVFTMTGSGLQGVGDPSAMFLADRLEGVAGSVVFPAVEGTRTLLLEVQALVARTTAPQPRRVAIGFDQRRLNLLLGVLTSHLGFPVDRDVFLAVAGGMKIDEPAADLAACAALVSALDGQPFDQRMVAFGEVGLAGEVRRVRASDRRLAEAARLGFTSAMVPFRTEPGSRSLRLLEVRDLEHSIVSGLRRAA